MTDLQEYISFAHSLVDMDEVKKGVFPLPTQITYVLSRVEHSALQTQVHDAKGLKKEDFEHQEDFTVSFLGIDFKFTQYEQPTTQTNG